MKRLAIKTILCAGAAAFSLSGCFHDDLFKSKDCQNGSLQALNASASSSDTCDSGEVQPEADTNAAGTGGSLANNEGQNGGGTSTNAGSTDTGGNTGNATSAFVPEENVYYKLQTMFLENEDKCLEGNKLGASSTLGGAAFMDSCQNVSGQLWKFVPENNGYYRLQTLFLEDENRCLESNKIGANATLKGASFMDTCQNVSGQFWKIVLDASNTGYYRLKSMFLEKDNKCLEGNLLASNSTLEGAAFMDTCQDVTGQLWKFVKTNATKSATTGTQQPSVTPAFTPDPNKYYKLQTLFLQDQNKCLEGNTFDAASTLEGAAFMDNCQNVTGQFWKFVSKGNGFYHMQTQFLEGDDKCLEGNMIGPTSTLGGASFMAGCGNFTGQLWKIVPDASGYHKLQTMASEKDGLCYEGNKLDPNSTLKGAAFMDNCQNVSGQLWIFSEI